MLFHLRLQDLHYHSQTRLHLTTLIIGKLRKVEMFYYFDQRHSPILLSIGVFPDIPPGVELRLDPAHGGGAMNPLAMYTMSLAALVDRLQYNWDTPASNWQFRGPPDLAIQVRKRRHWLTNAHVMLSVYFAVLQTEAALYVPIIAQAQLRGVDIGSVSIVKQSRTPRSKRILFPAMDDPSQSSTLNASSTADEPEQVVDPKDPTIAIEVRHTGRRVNCKNWFRLC